MLLNSEIKLNFEITIIWHACVENVVITLLMFTQTVIELSLL